MRIDNDPKLDFSDVLIRPKRSTLTSRKEILLERTFSFPHGQGSWTGIPIVASNMDGVGTLSMMKALSKMKVMTALHKHHPNTEYKNIARQYTFVSIGIKKDDEKRIKKLSKVKQLRFICIDAANGYTQRFVDFIKRIRDISPKSIIMAGNVVTGEMTEQLILSGADIVKVGIGSGSVCTTRAVTGVGYPQLSAIIECADAAHGVKGLVCSDGGCVIPGDVAKAFGAGADFVMLGGMLAGHTESEFDIIEENDKKFVEYYGSSSDWAMLLHNNGKAPYRAAEGRHVRIPHRGLIKTTIEEILGGIRSACTYVGAAKLKELSKCTTFTIVNRQLNTVFEKNEV